MLYCVNLQYSVKARLVALDVGNYAVGLRVRFALSCTVSPNQQIRLYKLRNTVLKPQLVALDVGNLPLATINYNKSLQNAAKVRGFVKRSF